jgi:hypothetical protein
MINKGREIFESLDTTQQASYRDITAGIGENQMFYATKFLTQRKHLVKRRGDTNIRAGEKYHTITVENVPTGTTEQSFAKKYY